MATKAKSADKASKETPAKAKKISGLHLLHGKKYRNFAKTFDRRKQHSLSEAVDIVVKAKELTKFDQSVEIHLNLNIDPKQADQIVRGTVVLPHGTGKDVRVIAFVDEGKVKEAKAAGATEAGTEDLIAKIEKGWLEFDVAVASPDQMKDLGKIAKILGQKGLMPNPKAGTVTPDIAKTIGEIKKGKVEFRVDKLSNLHNMVGKISFGADKIKENILTYVKAVNEAKPTGVKGHYINSITITSTMGPGIKLDQGAINN
jgi:large subunit ribosomal protein L1